MCTHQIVLDEVRTVCGVPAEVDDLGVTKHVLDTIHAKDDMIAQLLRELAEARDRTGR